MNYLASGKAPRRMGNAHPNIVPYQVFPVADGHVIVAVGNDGQFARFVAVLGGRRNWRRTSASGPMPAGSSHRAELVPLLTGADAQAARARICLSALEAQGVPGRTDQHGGRCLRRSAGDRPRHEDRPSVAGGQGRRDPVRPLAHRHGRPPMTSARPSPRLGEHTRRGPERSVLDGVMRLSGDALFEEASDRRCDPVAIVFGEWAEVVHLETVQALHRKPAQQGTRRDRPRWSSSHRGFSGSPRGPAPAGAGSRPRRRASRSRMSFILPPQHIEQGWPCTTRASRFGPAGGCPQAPLSRPRPRRSYAGSSPAAAHPWWESYKASPPLLSPARSATASRVSRPAPISATSSAAASRIFSRELLRPRAHWKQHLHLLILCAGALATKPSRRYINASTVLASRDSLR